MADKKISALTSATTPLAGTEVLPIVQGGATVKVAVSNLTAGRAISASTVAVGGTNLLNGVACFIFDGGVSDGVIFDNTSATGSGQFAARFRQTGAYVGSIQTTATATFFVTASDYRLKEQVKPMTGALQKIVSLNPVTYKWKSTNEDGQGFIAHELQAVFPDAVMGEKDATETVETKDEAGNVISTETVPLYQGIDTSFIVAALASAIKELNVELDKVKAELATLKGN